MDEYHLVTELLNLQKRRHQISLHIDFLKDDPKSEKAEQDLHDIEDEMRGVEKKLINLESRPYSKKAKQSIIDQLNSYIAGISNDDPKSKVSRKQSKTGDDNLFSYIINDVATQITAPPTTVKGTDHLLFY
jgi:hypothetical protein